LIALSAAGVVSTGFLKLHHEDTETQSVLRGSVSLW